MMNKEQRKLIKQIEKWSGSSIDEISKENLILKVKEATSQIISEAEIQERSFISDIEELFNN